MLQKKKTAEDGSVRRAEADVVDGIRRGDLACFEKLFLENWDPLCRYAFHYVRSTDDAEEVVQRVFTRIWENRSEWSVRGSVHDYLYLAARNASFDHLRHSSVERRYREREVAEILGTSADAELPSDARVLTHEFDAIVERAFADLPPKRREICELRLTGGLSYLEISSRLNISPKTVETQIARGLKYLRARLVELRA
jgi:RNA polymerase sigma-70 factor (ECF subfamily)